MERRRKRLEWTSEDLTHNDKIVFVCVWWWGEGKGMIQVLVRALLQLGGSVAAVRVRAAWWPVFAATVVVTALWCPEKSLMASNSKRRTSSH